MSEYDFTSCLSPLDFEILSKDLLEEELGIQLENFREGRDKGIDLRYAPLINKGKSSEKSYQLIVQCKRYSKFSDLKSSLKNKELTKIVELNPDRYILTTSVSLTPQQVDELKTILSPYVNSTGDIYGRERLNRLLHNHQEVERRHVKLWATSTGVLESIINASTHIISQEEVNRTIRAAKLYVRNPSFDEALSILQKHKVCIISGLPGIGKTTLARMLLLYFNKKKFDIVKIERDIHEARSVSYHNRPRFYYYDDFLGQTAQADKLNKNEDQALLDFMASVKESENSILVLTTREYILNQAKLHYEKLDREKFNHRTCVIDLSKYSRKIRAEILYNHLHFSDLPRTHLESLVKGRGYLKVIDHENYNPRLVELLTSSTWVGDAPSKEYPEIFLNNLDNPSAIWNHAFNNQLSATARHLLFVLTTLPVKVVSEHLERAFKLFHKAQCSTYEIPNSASDYLKSLKELDGTFITTSKDAGFLLVSFQNPSVRDFMQNILLEGEILEDLIDSLTFFEQAQWFSNVLSEEKPKVPVQLLKMHARLVVVAMQKLLSGDSCGCGRHRSMNPYVHKAARLSRIGASLKPIFSSQDYTYMNVEIDKLTEELSHKKIGLYLDVKAIAIHELKYRLLFCRTTSIASPIFSY